MTHQPVLIALTLLAIFLRTPTPLQAQENAGHGAENHEATKLVTKDLTGPYRPQYQADLAKTEKAIFDEINSFRKSKKLSPVVRQDQLDQTALDFAKFMATTGKYGHFADERSFADRATAHGYDYCIIEENIAMEFKSNGFSTGPLANKFAKGWENSPPHRHNILQPAVTQTGVGVAQSDDTGAFFAVQLFGRPKSDMIEVQITNGTIDPVNYQIGEDKYELPPRYTRKHSICTPQDLALLKDRKPVNPIPLQNGMQFVVEQRGGSPQLIQGPPDGI